MFSKRLNSIRKKMGISQEALAEMLGVSRQAIQKWESGASNPDANNLLMLARALHVSVDWMLENDRRFTGEEWNNCEMYPNYSGMHVWESYQSQLMTEFKQSMGEGKNIQAYEALFNAIACLGRSREREQLSDICFQIVQCAPQREDYPYDEPSELVAIRKLTHAAEQKLTPPPAAVLRERIHGAWMGRICGCMLGKPLEGKMTEVFLPVLKATGNYPIKRYMVSADFGHAPQEAFNMELLSGCLGDTVECAPVDDDTNYTVLASEIVERYGRDFAPSDVASAWIALQSRDAYCTAERVAYKNLIAGYPPPESAQYKNPYREWIGAQIRGDYYGYINPADPQTAADMAWRDACVSHVKNGIYGEMLVAAMLAAAAAIKDPKQIICHGLDQIPPTSRLYHSLVRLLDDFDRGMPEEACLSAIHERYDENDPDDWTHTIPNAEIIVASLLYGFGSFAKAIGLAVQCGFDTDCNGATVGSIFGMAHGVGAIGDAWTRPLRDTLNTSVFGVGKISVEELVNKTMRHIGLKR